MAVVDLRVCAAKVDDRAVGDLEIGGMAGPHLDVHGDPAQFVAGIDRRGQAAVDRRADLLESVDDDTDPAALAACEEMDETGVDL